MRPMAQNIYLCEGSVGEGRPELRNNGVSQGLVHAVLLECKSIHAANDYSVTVSG